MLCPKSLLKLIKILFCVYVVNGAYFVPEFGILKLEEY